MSSTVELRPATSADAAALERLAQLDSARVPAGSLLVAESCGELRAALCLETGEAIADPFAPTAHVVDALRVHAAGVGRKATEWRSKRPCQARLAT